MKNAAEIYLWGTRIGTVWKPDEDICVSFEFDHDFQKSGIELAPFRMPLSNAIYRFPELSRVDSFYGMPGLLANSLPDKFGNTIINKWLLARGINPECFTAIERLCFTGKRGMGALEIVPSNGPASNSETIDINEMAELASDLFASGKSRKWSTDDPAFEKMLEIGTAAGGARAKALVAWNDITGEFCSAQKESGEVFRHWLIKFDGVEGNGDRGIVDKKQHTRIEYAYYLMALDAGIEMQECRLYEKEGKSHFMTLRFDREGDSKVHVQTLASLGHFDYNEPRSCSYELYAAFASKLHSSLQEKKQIFKRAVLNFVAVNCDDHVKNFSFMMDKRGEWKITPAYDITFAFVPGHQWLGTHQMTLNGKASGIEIKDLMAFGQKIGLSESYCRAAIEEIMIVVGKWMNYAEKCGISEERAQEIADVINQVGLARIG